MEKEVWFSIVEILKNCMCYVKDQEIERKDELFDEERKKLTEQEWI